MRTVSAVYDTHSQARSAVDAIEKAGVASGDVSLIAHKSVSDKYDDVTDVSKAGAGAGIGGVVGGGAGLLAGLGLLAIPGLGPVVAAGWLAATAVGVAAGAAAGGLVGALVSAGVPEEHAHVYSESVRRGGTLVSARVDDGMAPRIQEILNSYKPIDPVERGNAYRKEGWTTFDAKAAPYTPNQSEIERIRRSHDIAP